MVDTDVKGNPTYIEIDGFRLSEPFNAEKFRSATAFKPSVEDIIVATYPKCGTTWMCQIVRLILMKGEHTKLNSTNYHKCFPFLELYGVEGVHQMLRPSCIKTHMPFDRINFSPEAKYIYIARHPRDCVVSFYHHTKYFPGYRFSEGSFDTFFDLFVNGMTDFNDYFDHLLSWYEQRHRSNILFMTYESMKVDHRDAVLKVTDFLNCPLTEEQIDNVIKYSSFEYMKKETNDVFDDFFGITESQDKVSESVIAAVQKAVGDGHKPIGKFIRKGEVGEGKSMLSQKQEEELQRRIFEKTTGSDVMNIWKKL